MIDFKLFRAKLLLQGLTIKEWCKLNNFDQDRLNNIRYGKIKNISNKERELIESVLRGE